MTRDEMIREARRLAALRRGATKDGWMAVGTMVEHVDDSIPDICTTNHELFGQGKLYRSREEQCANAELIAAAPYMAWLLGVMADELEACDE